jgi:hypothetical protein
MTRWCFFAPLVALVVSSCGGGSGAAASTIEQALLSHKVPGLGAMAPIRSVSCSRSDFTPPSATASFDCEAVTRVHPQWLTCWELKDPLKEPLSGSLLCARSGAAPEGVPVFTTPELRAAPKEAVFKCEDVDEAGRDIGPVYVALKGRPNYPAEKTDWMTVSDARGVAAEHHAKLFLDC